MKAYKVIGLLASLLPLPTLAVENGIAIDWTEHQSLVEMNCSGTVLSGDWVITAAHCAWPSAGGLRPVKTFDGKSIDTVAQIDHPNYNLGGVDIGLWKLSSDVLMSNIEYLANIDNPTNDVKNDETVRFLGFGHNNGTLNQATQKTIPSSLDYKIFLQDQGLGTQIEGDSGGPNFNIKNEIIGITDAKTSPGDAYQGGTAIRLSHIRNFILDNIDAWHYPTIAKTNLGSVTIKVQSLHKNDVVDTAYTDGDATIIGGTCQTTTTIKPFETCTYEIASNGKEGKLYLTDTESITINKKNAPTPNNNTNNSGSSSGGSLNILSLLGLLGFASRRFR